MESWRNSDARRLCFAICFCLLPAVLALWSGCARAIDPYLYARWGAERGEGGGSGGFALGIPTETSDDFVRARGAVGRPVRSLAEAPAPPAAEAAPAPPPEAPKAPPAPASVMVPGGEGDAQPPPVVDLSAKKRLVIYTAQFSLLVANVEDSMKALLEKIKQWDGYVERSDLRRVTFRIPADRFDRVAEEISRMGVVTDKQIQAEDVTRQYADLQLRLEVAETSRKRLLSLLEKAQKVEDLLKIENEIRRLTEEIERMKAELRTLADRIAYSTITVDLTAKAAEAKQPRRRRTVSYFFWINQIGAENVTRYF